MKTSSSKGGKGSKGRPAEDKRRIQTEVPPPAGPEAAAAAATASSTALVWLHEVGLGDWVEVQRLDDASSREQGFVAEVRRCCTHHDHHGDWVEVQRLDDASSREQGFVAEVRRCCTHHHHGDWVEA